MPEQWRTIPGFAGYEASSLGRVRSWRVSGWPVAYRAAQPKILKALPYGHGYLAVNIYSEGRQKKEFIHRLVLLAFVGPAPVGYWAAHGDGNRQHNALSNLRWSSPTENQSDKRRHGTHQQGEALPWHKITEAQAREIKGLLARGVRHRVIAEQFGITESLVSCIKRGKAWNHV